MPKFLNALLVVAITLAAGSCPLFSAEKRTYHCYTISAPPRVDGLLDDEAWKSLPASNSFTILSTNEYAAKQTHIQLGWDRDHLYIGVRCDEPEMKLLSANMRDGDAIWGEDSIEIFFQPESGLGFYQFAVNSKGAKTGVERADGLTGFEAKGFHGPDFYSLEISMPFALFGKAAIPGAVWRGNIDRNIWAGGKVFTCWAPLQGSFHDTDNFGRFVFELSAAAEQSDASDRQYRDALIARVNDVVKKCGEYEADLVRGRDLPAYREEAQELQKRVSELKALQASMNTVSLRDLAAGTQDGEDFFKKLHDFKYRVLIAQLLADSDEQAKK